MDDDLVDLLNESDENTKGCSSERSRFILMRVFLWRLIECQCIWGRFLRALASVDGRFQLRHDTSNISYLDEGVVPPKGAYNER